MLQPFDVAQETLGAYRSYVRSSFPLRDPALDAERERLVDEGLLWADTAPGTARARRRWNRSRVFKLGRRAAILGAGKQEGELPRRSSD